MISMRALFAEEGNSGRAVSLRPSLQGPLTGLTCLLDARVVFTESTGRSQTIAPELFPNYATPALRELTADMESAIAVEADLPLSGNGPDGNE